jgi:hypothetical protein
MPIFARCFVYKYGKNTAKHLLKRHKNAKNVQNGKKQVFLEKIFVNFL